MSINFTVNTLILAKKYDSENLNKSDEKLLTQTNFKYLVSKNQSGLKKKMRERCESQYGLKSLKKDLKKIL